METGGRKPDWSYWRHASLGLTLEPEIRQWLLGGGEVGVARGIGFFAAAVCAAALAAQGIDAFWHGHAAAGCWHLLDAGLFLGLGCLLLAGKRWAALALMAVYTVDRIIGHVLAYRHGDRYYVEHLGLWLCLGVTAWALWMRVFTVAFRAEGRWAATGEAASAAGAPISPER